MPNQNNTLLIGKLLQNAGLVSEEQLEKALEVKSQYTEMRLGEILALQEVIKAQTASFFAERWQDMKDEGQKFPLGYYFKKAYLLNDEQIQAILAEQKKNKLKFGSIAVQKGWLEQDTVNFFLSELRPQKTKLISLIALEEYNSKFLHLEKKYANYSLLLSRILGWTGGDNYLTKKIGHIFAESNFNIASGMETSAVDRLIETALIKNWQTSKLGSYIRDIRNKLLNNQNCNPILLLQEYENVLLSNNKAWQQTKEQEELLNINIVVIDENYLKVTNLIFQQIFNQNWIAKSKSILESETKQKSISSIKIDDVESDLRSSAVNSIVQIKPELDKIIADNDSEIIDATSLVDETEIKTTENITKFSSLLTLAAITLLIPLVFAINNYSSSRREKKLGDENVSQANKLEQFCNEISLAEISSSVDLISKLEQNKESILRAFPYTLQGFPDNCEAVLNDLRVLTAPQLGKESRVLEAIRNLCKVPADADRINEAKIWIEHWYNSETWGKETKSYLNLVDDCPAGKQ
ncbi:MAG: hypothetical protein AAGE96_11280 [Cyanobacteria bacterium P01_G01_bin.19]